MLSEPTADERIAAYFEELISRNYKTPTDDWIIYLVVAVRCQMDMGGFNSVFEQLLHDEHSLQFFLDSLRKLDEPILVDAFARAHSRLKVGGYFDDPDLNVFDLEDEDSEDAFLQNVAEEVRESNRLWELDEKLCQLIPLKS